jgi:hypothetical protein
MDRGFLFMGIHGSVQDVFDFSVTIAIFLYSTFHTFFVAGLVIFLQLSVSMVGLFYKKSDFILE